MTSLIPTSFGPTDSPRVLHAVPHATWQFRLLHLAGLLVTLPVVAAARVLLGARRQRRDESIFAEANRGVLTALGNAFMA
jgi:hypothetical protein